MTANDKRIAEANECVKRAENALKTSLIKLKLKPDYDIAAVEYDRATVCLKNADQLQKALEMCLKAIEYHGFNSNRFHQAKPLELCTRVYNSNKYEQASQLCRDLGDGEGAASYMERAADGYVESGSLDTAAMALDKVAKQLENSHPDRAIQVYEKALDLVSGNDRSRMAGEFLNRLTRLFLLAERYTDAINTINTEMDRYIEVQEAPHVGRLALALVVIRLAMGDSVAAEKSLQSAMRCPGLDEAIEVRAGASLIAAFESGDDATLQNCLQHPTLKAMDNQYLRLMKKLKLSEKKKKSEDGQFEEEEDEDDLK